MSAASEGQDEECDKDNSSNGSVLMSDCQENDVESWIKSSVPLGFKPPAFILQTRSPEAAGLSTHSLHPQSTPLLSRLVRLS